MLARLQQILAGVMLLAAVLWVLQTWAHSPVVAAAGVLVLAVWHAVFLAFEFIAVYVVNRHDSTPFAGVGPMARAWVGESIMAPRVFLWRQPFRSHAVPDCLSAPEGTSTPLHGRRGVVFIHGFVCNRGFWNPWMAQLKERGHAFVAVNLEPVFGAIDDYVPLVDAAVTRVTQATGLPPLVVCHSMGGLAVRAWLRARQADARVHHVITIGSPHHGTWLSRFAFSANGLQMHQRGLWLQQLSLDEPASRSQRFTCFYSNCDNIVFPASTATLAGADNRLVTGVAHVALAFDQTVMSTSVAMLLTTD